MSTSDRDRWNTKYSQRTALNDVAPDSWLRDAVDTIMSSSPRIGRRALDVACGLGHNATWLAQQGWCVDGLDISRQGLHLAASTAERHGHNVNWVEADLDEWTPETDAYDLVVVFRFLDRVTVPRIVQTGLRPGGWLVYETFSAGQLLRPDSHIRNPDFVLAKGELEQMFPDFDVVDSHEDVLDDRTVERFLARRHVATSSMRTGDNS